MAILNNSNAISSGGYDINNSLRFRASNSAYLSRTLTTPTNNKIWTLSLWVKRSTLTTTQVLFGTASEELRYIADGGASGVVDSFQYNAGAGYGFRASATYRDVSAWYHLVIATDTTQATAANRVKFYVNGVQATTDGTYDITQNTNTQINSAVAHNIGRRNSGSLYFDGYMTEINFVDGQQLTPSSFGETDTTTGSWKPKAYSGTFGTNGFYLKFSDIATTSGSNAGLGKDFSGNANYWTTNNISVTAGTTYDAMTDSPTLTSATVANYAVMNPIWAGYGTPTFSNANLTTVTTTAQTAVSTMTFPNASKTYLETTFTAGTAPRVGIRLVTDVTQYGGWIALNDGSIRLNDVNQQTGLATWTTNDVISMAVDLSANTLQFYKNNVAFGTANTITNSSDWVTQTQCNSGSGLTNTIAWNFGQRPFTYTPPTGFKALNTYNLPDSTIKKGNVYMDATTYTGAGNTSTSITNASGFKPDFVWTKARSIGYNNYLYDSVRGTGTGTSLISNLTDAQGSNATNANLSSFNSNGWTIGTTSGTNAMNASGQTFVGWQWQAGQGSTSSNTSGSITSTVSVNTTAGFSVVTYTGTGANATVGHGLGVAPKFLTVKRRSAVGNWMTWHTSLTGTGPYLILNSANAAATGAWNNTLPTSTVFSLLGSDTDENANGSTYVAYCWAEIAGYSKFGSYTGNGSADGPMIFTGFSPKYWLVKRTDSADDWFVFDSAREPYNTIDLRLCPNGSFAEASTTTGFDFLANGVKVRSSGTAFNANGGTYIYMAFAESPFKSSLAR